MKTPSKHKLMLGSLGAVLIVLALLCCVCGPKQSQAPGPAASERSPVSESAPGANDQPATTQSAEAPESEGRVINEGGAPLPPEPIRVNKIYFLIHPLTYVPECAASGPGSYSYLDQERYQAYRECENTVRRRYHEAIDKMKEDEALVIYPSLYPSKDDPHPQELVDIVVMARRKLGRRLVLCTYPTTSAEFVKLAKEQGLTYDPQTVVTEGWGESFDGCVAKYCSVFTTELGLVKPI